MIGIVVGDYQNLSQDIVTRRMRERSEQTGVGIRDESLKSFVILLETDDGLLPSQPVGLFAFSRPVPLGPGWGYMLRVADELQDIPLSDAHMLQQAPGCVWNTGGRCVDLLYREPVDGFLKRHVGISALE